MTYTLKDGPSVPSIIEQEPGSEGKLLITRFKQEDKLKRHTIRKDKVTKSKLDRSFDLEVLAESRRIKFDTDTMTRSEIMKCVRELIAFTGEEGGEDNIVDTMTGSARYWKRRATVLKPRRRRRN
jgi:phage terminase large subunit-like protein